MCKRIRFFLIQMVFAFGFLEASQGADKPCQQWAGSILQELNTMAIASGPMHGECMGRGMVERSKVLGKFGFSLQNPPYSVEVISLGSSRYHITLQAMTDMHDRQEKIVRFNSAAESMLPKSKKVAVPAGKIQYTLAINYDMKEQLGVASHYEIFGEIRSFVDLVVHDPEKFSEFGFPLFQRMDSSLQLLYKGHNLWRISSRKGDIGPLLLYRNMTWSVADERKAAVIVPKETQAVSYDGIRNSLEKKVKLHQGDVVKEDSSVGPVTILTLSSQVPIAAIIEFYEKSLAGKGWETNRKMVQNDLAALVMVKQGSQLTISTANNKNLQGDAVSLYTLTLMGM